MFLIVSEVCKQCQNKFHESTQSRPFNGTMAKMKHNAYCVNWHSLWIRYENNWIACLKPK